MHYMLLIYDDEKTFPKMPEAQLAKFLAEYDAFTRGIVASGHFRAGGHLQGTAHATTVRERGGKALTVDGPFAETKEQLGGYYLVECKDLDEALEIARRIPSVRAGSIEVRPVNPGSEALRTASAR